MKNLKITLLAIVALVTFSCSDDDDNNNNGGSDATYVNYRVNGEQINIDEPATITSLSTLVTAMEGDGANMRSISLWMPNDASVGTHEITEEDLQNLTNSYTASIMMDEDTEIEATSGTLTITEMGSEYMKGTFSFTGELNGTTYTVTNGEFRAYKPSDD